MTERVAEIILPTSLCIAIRRVLGIKTRTIVRYPIGAKDWKFQLEKVEL